MASIIANAHIQHSAISCGHVCFTPDARTAWHSHPKGSDIVRDQWCWARVGHRNGVVEEIRPSDVVFIEPSEEHWHGATPDRFMAHIAIVEADENGQVVTWGKHVTDEEYTQGL